MRKVTEVLRLRFGLGLKQNQIARSCSMGQATVHRYLERAEAAGLSWPLPEGCDEERLQQLFFGRVLSRPATEPSKTAVRATPDFALIFREKQSGKYVTLQLLWQEYREGNPDGYRYSRFCELYHRWRKTQSVVLRQEHKAGEKTFVDWAGATIPIRDRVTGEVSPASLFVAVLGASSYAFARATPSQNLMQWIECHTLAFEFFQGTTKLVVPDNPKTGVTRACRYEPDLNLTYMEMAKHYGVAVMPARPRKPRDKAKVEAAVLLVERWIVAALRHIRFYSVGDLNEAIATLLERLNSRPFRKRAGSRASLYAELDRPLLQPLPPERYVSVEWKQVRANIDYHVEIDRHYYSVPYQLAGQLLEARFNSRTVEIFHRGNRVASHQRAPSDYRHTVIADHMPSSHKAHVEWTPSRILHWAGTVGNATAEVVKTILESKPHPEMGYRACLGILRLGKAYTNIRLEAACLRALQLNACSYQSLSSILKRSLDRQTTFDPEPDRPGTQHRNLRGAGYYKDAPPSTFQ